MDDVLDTIQLLEEIDDVLFDLEENEDNESQPEMQGNDGDVDGQ